MRIDSRGVDGREVFILPSDGSFNGLLEKLERGKRPEAEPTPTPTPEVGGSDQDMVDSDIEEEDGATTITTEDEEVVNIEVERKQLLVRIPSQLNEEDAF